MKAPQEEEIEEVGKGRRLAREAVIGPGVKVQRGSTTMLLRSHFGIYAMVLDEFIQQRKAAIHVPTATYCGSDQASPQYLENKTKNPLHLRSPEFQSQCLSLD